MNIIPNNRPDLVAEVIIALSNGLDIKGRVLDTEEFSKRLHGLFERGYVEDMETLRICLDICKLKSDTHSLRRKIILDLSINPDSKLSKHFMLSSIESLTDENYELIVALRKFKDLKDSSDSKSRETFKELLYTYVDVGSEKQANLSNPSRENLQKHKENPDLIENTTLEDVLTNIIDKAFLHVDSVQDFFKYLHSANWDAKREKIFKDKEIAAARNRGHTPSTNHKKLGLNWG